MKFLFRKPIFVTNSRVPRWLSIFIEIGAITIFPFVFVRGTLLQRTRTHETIHFKQYLETWIVGFLPIYLFDYVLGMLKYKNDRKKAYRQIRFEQEAYAHEEDSCYPEHRTKRAWLKYKV